MLPRLPKRDPESHKGDFGRVLLIGGSRGMAGSIALSGMAALRSGAGLVTLAVPEVCLDAVAVHEPSYMTLPLPADTEGRLSAAALDELTERIDQFDAVALGPGLGRSPGLDDLVARLYAESKAPLVCDADGLNSLAAQPAVLRGPGGPRVLTPHPGEFRRLVGIDDLAPAEMPQHARRLAREASAIVLLKGHRTLVTDGADDWRNETGNPGMATGGAGDVLTGVIAALLGQGLTARDAARLGAHVHGRAGDLAAEELGMVGMIASDVARRLPAAFQEL